MRLTARYSVWAARLVCATTMCLLLSALVPLFADEANIESKDEPKRPTRAESFIGIHFDFHANPDDKNIGANTTPEMVQAIIDAVHPDFIQVDSKGHPGWCSYETKVGNMAPGVVVDSLKVWREVTAKNGVALYTHYSGVWDSAAVEKHPEWAVEDQNGAPSKQAASVFKGYREGLLVPQLLEFALDYQLDGIWVDGECWGTAIDFSEVARESFKKATGRGEVPMNPAQDGWKEWCDFHREAFREYLRSYVKEVKAKAPNYQIASNWAFTDHMAEPVSAPVDFISGDYSPNDSVNAARYSGRLMANQGIAWDLMAWSFGTRDGAWAQKPGFQLAREAACVLALGGTFQAYITQNRDGSVNLEKIPAMAETADFCRARQSLCKGSTGVPQVALFCPTEEDYARASARGGELFPFISWQRPILNRLLETNYSVDILLDEHLAKRISDFPIVVFFRGGRWSESLRKSAVAYLQNGGAVLLLGDELDDEYNFLLKNAVPNETEKVKIDDNVEESLEFYRIGRGIVARCGSPKSDELRQQFDGASGDFFGKTLSIAMNRLFPKPILSFAKPEPLDVSIRRDKNGVLCAHLVNVSGPHAQAGILESIEPVENVQCSLNLENKPTSIRLEPSGIDLDFKWEKGVATFAIPSIPIYEIVTIK